MPPWGGWPLETLLRATGAMFVWCLSLFGTLLACYLFGTLFTQPLVARGSIGQLMDGWMDGWMDATKNKHNSFEINDVLCIPNILCERATHATHTSVKVHAHGA